MKSWLVLAASSMALACVYAAGPPLPATQPPPLPGAAASAAAPPAVTLTPEVRSAPELGRELEAARVTGTIAWFDSQTGVLSCSDVKRCREAVTPASTFKIPHSMIALETGIVDGPDSVLPWDKQQYWNENWNHDLSFRDAFRFSCYPCYRDIAKKVGEKSELAWLDKLRYGNGDASGGVEKFWIWGGLRISPVEQINFLRRFDSGKLPISERTADIVRDIMTLDVTETYVLRGKTGSTAPPEEERELGWFVGWLEQGERRVFFALLLDGHAPGVELNPLRRPLTERILKSQGLM